MLRQNVSDDDDNDNNHNLLHRCITEDDFETFASLINADTCTTESLKQKDENGETILHLIVRANKSSYIQALLSSKAYSLVLLEIENDHKETAWSLAVAAGIEAQFARRTKLEVETVLSNAKQKLLLPETNLPDTNPELSSEQVKVATKMIEEAEKTDLEMIKPADAIDMMRAVNASVDVIASDPNNNADLLKLYQQEIARQQAIPRSWSRVFVAAMATILCLSLLAVAISVSVASLGVSVPFVAAGLGLLGLVLTENAIVASIGFGLVVPMLAGFSTGLGMYAVKHRPTRSENISIPGIKP